MSNIREVKSLKMHMGRLAHGSDLYNEITNFCVDKKIFLGKVEALGAVKRARLASYNQTSQAYNFFRY